MELYGKFTDAQLLTLLRESDQTAFNTLYLHYHKRLYFVAVSKLQDEHEATEAVQDIFISLWNNRHTFELKPGFEHYFNAAMRYQVIKRLARRQRLASRETSYDHQPQASLPEPQTEDLDQESMESLCQQLREAIDTLPPKCQLVFKMSRSAAYTNKKIAAELGITEKAVEKHITSALKILKANLGSGLAIALILHQIPSLPKHEKPQAEKNIKIFSPQR